MPTDHDERMRRAREIVAEYLSSWPETIALHPNPDDVYVVWFCKTLQNWKALLSTDLVSTGIYFEVTYDGDKGRAYLDHYQKLVNQVVPDPA